LFVLVILAHERRRIIHLAVTAQPTAAWTAQQFRDAFPWDQAPRYLIHDRDLAFHGLTGTAPAMGIEEVRTAPRSPWQNAYVERFIGSVHRECLDHVIVLTAAARRILNSYVAYYMDARTHLSLDKDSPHSRSVWQPVEGLVGHSPRRRPSSPIRTSRRMTSVGFCRRAAGTSQTASSRPSCDCA
jgi:transposase InsO family protein